MSKVSITRSLLDDLAMSISNKSGEPVPLTLTEMKDAVDSISGGDITVESLSVTANGTYTAQSGHAYSPVTVSVPTPTPTLQTKSVSYTPSETAQTESVTADSGYDGLDTVSISVGAIDSNYVGSGITRRDSTDLTASGATVTVPSGYYSAQASKAVASGSAKTPATTITTNPTISVSSSGLITASASATKSVTPTVSAGYVSSGTSGTITVSGSNTSQLSTQSATTITPTTASQTAVSAGKYTTGAITVGAIPSEYIVPSGSISITDNGTVDVTNYASAVVSVAGGGGASQTIYCGESAPSSSTGSNGDVYIITSGGGNLEAYPASFTSSGMSSTSNASACIGKSASAGSATGNMYSSGSGSTGVVEYAFDLSSIPSSATIDSVSCQVKAHEENASKSSMTLQLYAGNTAKGSATTVDGTSNTIYTLTTGTWTRSEIDSLVLHTTYGYYGGLVAGATLTIAYSMSEASYDVTLTGSSSGWSISGDGIYQKSSGSWSSVSSVTLESSIARG